MKKDIFAELYSADMPPGLYDKVVKTVHKRLEHEQKLKLLGIGSIAVVSLGATFPAFLYLTHSFSQSGFYQYVNLAFSDNGVLLSYWKDLSASLVETLPVLGLTAFLSTILVFMWSFTTTIKNTRRIFIGA